MIYLARSERFELPTPRFEVWCSIQLSYERLAQKFTQNCGELPRSASHGRASLTEFGRKFYSEIAIGAQILASRSNPAHTPMSQPTGLQGKAAASVAKRRLCPRVHLLPVHLPGRSAPRALVQEP